MSLCDVSCGGLLFVYSCCNQHCASLWSIRRHRLPYPPKRLCSPRLGWKLEDWHLCNFWKSYSRGVTPQFECLKNLRLKFIVEHTNEHVIALPPRALFSLGFWCIDVLKHSTNNEPKAMGHVLQATVQKSPTTIARSQISTTDLYDGLGAAAVCPNFKFEWSRTLMFQQMFHIQRFNATFCKLPVWHRPMSNNETQTDRQYSSRRGTPCLWVSQRRRRPSSGPKRN